MSKPWEINFEDPSNGDQESAKVPLPWSEKDPLMKKSAPPRCDLFGVRSWLRELKNTFGLRLLILLFAVQHCLKGFSDSFSGKAVPYMFKAYGVPAPQAQVFTGVAMLPWAMKPIIG